jgi:hypothetical protein
VLALGRVMRRHPLPGTLVGVGGTCVVEQWFRRAMMVRLLKEKQFTPAGLRAGRAIYDYLAGSPAERLIWHGRQAAVTTLEHNGQECAALRAPAARP